MVLAFKHSQVLLICDILQNLLFLMNNLTTDMNSTSNLDPCYASLYPVSAYDDIGYHFLRSGRPGFVEEKRGRCIAIAVAMFRFRNRDTLSEDFHFWNKDDANKRKHSETLILNRLQQTENKLESEVEKLRIYGSYSPCSVCCRRLIDFLNKRPSCSLYLAFSTVYQCEVEKHCSALRELKRHFQVRSLDVFNAQDWQFLSIRGNLKLSLADKQWMDRFDEFWRLKLENILQDQNTVQNTVSHVKKKVQITKPGRSRKRKMQRWLRERWKMRRNKVKSSAVRSGETENHNSVPIPVNSGQQIHNLTATNIGQQKSVTESLQHIPASTSTDLGQQISPHKATNITEGFIAGNAHRRLKRKLEELAQDREVNEKRAREVEECVAQKNSLLPATPSENTANESTKL